MKRFKTVFLIILLFHFIINLQEGSIGHDVVIKPLPFGLINNDNVESRAHHIVYKQKAGVTEQNSDFGKFFESYKFELTLMHGEGGVSLRKP